MWNLLNTKSDFTFFCFLLPVFITLFSAISVWLVQEKTRSKRNLCILMWALFLCMTANIVNDYILSSPPYPIYRFLDAISSIFATFLMFIYLTSIIRPQKWCLRVTRPWFIVAGLLVLVEIILVLSGFNHPDIYTWEEYRKVLWQPAPLLHFIASWYFVFCVFYVSTWVFLNTYRYRKQIAESHSYFENIHLTWIYYICSMLVVFGLSAAVYATHQDLIYKTIFSLATFVLMFAIYILGSRQGEVPYTDDSPIVAKDEDIEPRSKQLMEKIDLFFEEDKPYLDPSLTVIDVANALHSNRTYISKALNQEKGITFYQYVNRFRIEFAVDLLLLDGKRQTIEAVAKRVGFNSLTTFYYFFKQEKGCTPRQFIKAESEKQKREAQTPL